jgi:hypothetical protein
MMHDPLNTLFARLEAIQRADEQRVKGISDAIGHNGGPPLESPFGLKAAWVKMANEYELRRLAKLHLRIERKKAALKELTDERRSIMMRCIRRMRRRDGKQ